MNMRRICIPPINGGKNCVGSTIVEKPCNIEPCEEGKINSENGIIQHDLPEIEGSPRIMMKRISNRPQRYEECVIREGDINMLREDMTQFSELPRLPVRAVLNMKTFTIFESDKFDSIIAGFNLDDTYIRD